jgi:hypothetical protein
MKASASSSALTSLTAMTAVENIVNGVTTKDNIWAINTEMEYLEEK